MQRDAILVIDIEATCWEDDNIPPGEMSEIIEIGLCLLNPQTHELGGKQSLLIRPTRSKVSPFCTELTSITPEMVAEGMSFEAACAILQAEYQSGARLWGSWGAYDYYMFKNQANSFGVDYPLGPCHLNIKQAFARLQTQKPSGMAAALASLGLALEGTHHRGGDDAWNIAKLLAHLIRHHGQDFLPWDCVPS
jgi:inhibitor of KinA sporulation pathway (predicted exonuclease)